MNVFDLYASVTLDTDDYEKQLGNAKKKTSTFGDVLKATLTSQAIVGGIKTLAGAVKSVGEAALEGYAEYEQLVGGVETLFKNSAGAVQEYANNAYKSAGMSANEYMSTVTSFSASLLQSLGGDTAEAANYADRAIVSMADNANKMGTSIDMIQNAYQGFAKQNYTMLDNLKLGYGGTKEEMERLISEAAAMTAVQRELGITVDESSMSFANIVNAIEVMQYSLGIAGATAAEASSTIEGSLSAAKSAWSNLLVGIADENANLEDLATNFVKSVSVAADNILPRIGTIVKRVVESFVNFMTEQGPVILQTGADLLSEMVTGIVDGIPDMIERIPAVIEGIINFVTKNLPKIIELGTNLLISLANGIIGAIPLLVARLPKLITTFVQFITSNFPQIVNSGMQIIENLVIGLIKAIPEIATAVPKLISAIVNGITALESMIYNVGSNVVQWIMNGISAAWSGLVSWFNNLWSNLFGNRTANVAVNRTVNNVGATAIDGSHANGLDYVPYDGYIAELHKGEAVITAAEARSVRRGDNTPINIVVQSVLDGKVIGETAYSFITDHTKAFGGAY